MSSAHVEEFTVPVGGRAIVARLHAPPADRLAARPALLLTFASDRVTALTVAPYSEGTDLFLAAGHRVLSFDLPQHGARENEHGAGIVGFRNAFIAGRDPFAEFVADGVAVIDRCLALGLAAPGRIVICGTSRGAYMALRLLAADHRLLAGAALAPVTDWRELSEFRADRDRTDVADLRLTRWVDDLAGHRVYIAIGNHDERVGTATCIRFYLDLLDANLRAGFDPNLVDFLCTPDPGHTLGEEWRRRGVEMLLSEVQRD